MKELSIEEKAKRYDEAKLRIRAAYNSNRCTIGFMNEIFPELKESKDEEIRKEIIEQINLLKSATLSDLKVNQFNSWIDWLENQSKQKFLGDLTQQEAMDIAVAKCFEQGEQNPTDIENAILNFAMQFHDNRMKPESEWEDEVKMLRDNISSIHKMS